MDSNDVRLIDDLARELQKAQPVQKDPEAQALIAQRIAAQPDALYLLTQAVLLQQDALRQAQARIQRLEEQARPVRGGFFSGLFGGGPSQAEARHPAPQYTQPGRPDFGQPAYAQPYGAARGSSFLGQAASTAVGVAGGMFLFEGISNMFDAGGGEQAAFEQGYDQGFDQGQDAGAGDPGADASGFDQAGFDQGWDQQDFGGDFGV